MYERILRLSLKALTVGVFLGFVLFLAYGRRIPPAGNPRIVVLEQPGSPLLLLSTFVDASNDLSPRYGYSITNTSDKPICAYAIQESASLGKGAPSDSATFTHFPAVKLFIAPHASRQEEGGAGRVYQAAPDKVVLSVDFVEFADGKRWGEDTGSFGQMLDGKREGGRAAMKKYREILASEGIDGLDKGLAKPDFIRPEVTNKSDAWLRGFRMGVTTTKSRVTAASKKGGQEGVRSELDKPFDSREGRKEP
jgi:hypothetical protein